MKKANILLLGFAIAGVIIIGQFQTSASEIGETEDKTAVEQENSQEQELETGSGTETVTEAVEGSLGGNDASDVPKNEAAVTEDFQDNETLGLDNEGEDAAYTEGDDETEAQDMEEEQVAALYDQGLKYYCNCYQYECEIVYLKKYLEYVRLEVAACKEMHDLGEMTAADLKSYQARQASIEAQIKVAENQKSYNNLFLEDNNLDYHDYVIKEKKNVKSIEDYLEQYPEKNHMTMAGYVTNYNNALAYIEAKKMELDALEMKLDAAKLLYNAGEMSKLELKQQEIDVAKAQYELEQYYVEMNLAYINLNIYCR